MYHDYSPTTHTTGYMKKIHFAEKLKYTWNTV